MKLLKIFIALTLITLSTPLTLKAQQKISAHQKAHKELLAKQQNSFDKGVLEEIIRNDIMEREQEVGQFGNLSRESINMIADLLEEAKSHTGKKYVHGGKGPNVFDCSGFTGYVYKQFGYPITTASRAQYNEGVSVSRNQLRPGDLVFFTSPRSGKNVGHVGIVVTVDNENNSFTFIHASVNKGISIESSNAKYYASRYVGARRIITE